MSSISHILSEGIPPGLIFGVIVFFIWGLTAIFGKSKTPPLKQPTRESTDLAESRRRILEQQAAAKRTAQGQLQKAAKQAKKKAGRQSAPPPPPMPTSMPMPTSTPMRAPAQTRIVSSPIQSPISAALPRVAAPPPLPLTAHRPNRSETAQNVRMLLKNNSIDEAFVLGEILGRPKGLE